MPRCDHCGNECNLPFQCNYCGGKYCSDCRLPPYHDCSNIETWENQRTIRVGEKWGNQHNPIIEDPYNYRDLASAKNEVISSDGGSFKMRAGSKKSHNSEMFQSVNLKNVTILSLILIFIAIVSISISPTQFIEISQIIFAVGFFGMSFCYFIYAIKHWGTFNYFLATFMLTIPCLVYFFSTTRISGFTDFLFYFFIGFLIYGIIFVIVLLICDKIRWEIERHLLKTKRYSLDLYPKTSYAVIGIFFISFLVIGLSGPSIFFENVNTIWHSNNVPNQNSGIPFISSTDYSSAIERSIFDYTNLERQKNGKKRLIWDDKLAEIAREHSKDMATNNFFSHDNPAGEDPTARAIRHKYPVHKELGGGLYSEGIAENIGMMPTGNVAGIGYVSNDADSVAKAQVTSWMESPGHRQNILDPEYQRLGVGVAHDGENYISTQNFW